MKKTLLAAIALFGMQAFAQLHSFRCTGITEDTGDKVVVSGRYIGSAGNYSMDGNLHVNGTDGSGNSFTSDGSGGTSRKFSEYAVTLGSNNGVFYVIAKEPSNNSRLVVTHYEADEGGDSVVVDLKSTATKDPYKHKFENAKCQFKHAR